MIAFVEGELSAIEQSSVIVDCSGVGFRVFTPVNEEIMRIGIGGDIKLYTYFSIREGAMELYGFTDTDRLDMFKLLINVNSVGPKAALTILSSMDLDQLMMAIASDDKKAMTKVPGIGPKTAARILLDLKDKVTSLGTVPGELSGGTAPAVRMPEGPAQEAVEALTSLGYSPAEAQNAVKRAMAQKEAQGADVETILRLSLKQL